jgi:hypothetical protein
VKYIDWIDGVGQEETFQKGYGSLVAACAEGIDNLRVYPVRVEGLANG